MIFIPYQEGVVIYINSFSKNCLNTTPHQLGLNPSLPGTSLIIINKYISTLLENFVLSYIALHSTDAQYLLDIRLNEELSCVKHIFQFRDNSVISMKVIMSLSWIYRLHYIIPKSYLLFPKFLRKKDTQFYG